MASADTSIRAWKRLAAAKMCGYALGRFGHDSGLIRWLNSLTDEEWVEACLSPFLSNIILDSAPDWDPKLAIAQTQCLLKKRHLDRYPCNDPPVELLKALQSMGIGSRRTTCENANFILADHVAWAHWSSQLRDALTLLNAVDQQLAYSFYEVCPLLLLVDEFASFRGASGSAQRGLIFLSPEHDWDEITFAEELVHESTHCILDLVSICTPLFSDASAYEERYKSPFRPDPRPLFGNYHAVVVASRCIGFYRRLSEAFPERQNRAQERIADLRTRCRTPYEQLLAAPMTQVGTEILQGAVFESGLSDSLRSSGGPVQRRSEGMMNDQTN